MDYCRNYFDHNMYSTHYDNKTAELGPNRLINNMNKPPKHFQRQKFGKLPNIFLLKFHLGVIVPGIAGLDLLAVLVPLDLGVGIVHLALELQLPLRLALLVLQLAAEAKLGVRSWTKLAFS